MMTIRPAILADAAALARVMIEANQDAFRGRVPDQCLNWITPQESATKWRRTIHRIAAGEPECLLVAEADPPQDVVGFALVRLAPDEDARGARRGELRVISVMPACQRQGIGRRLVRAAAEYLISMDASSMIVRVLTVNPNCGFYEQLGARFLREEPQEWSGLVFPQSVYEWRDLSALLASA